MNTHLLDNFLRVNCTHKEFQYLSTIVLWSVLSFDGPVSGDEKAFLINFCESWEVEFGVLKPILSERPDSVLTSSLQLANVNLIGKGKIALLEIAILGCLADSKINYGELLLLHLVADALFIESSVFVDIYKTLVGNEPPNLGDPSSVSYYQRSNSSKGSTSANQRNNQSDTFHFNILGLEPDASLDAIRSAYRRLALLKHPDRAPNADSTTRQRMHEEFLEIKASYEFLTRRYE
ncbi:MAG: DnaJ domain-containing protein [Ignavibacteria bacterium]